MQQPAAVNAEPIPGYRLIERLGRGGYGEVWKAEAPGGMHKAIKYVFGDMDSVGGDNKGAEQEFRSLNRVKTIRHPFLLSLERIEVIDGQLLIVMELADRNLFDRFTEAADSGLPGIPRVELLQYMEEAAEALDLMNLHHQIQHLDIKPQNLFLVGRHIKVADFGLAKDLEGARAALTGGLTPMYAPPETFDGWVSRQSDQYSLAIVYMEMLIGKRPFNGSNTRQLVLQHLTGVPDLAGLSSPDREAISKALSKKPDERFSSCSEFVKALLGGVQLPGDNREKKPVADTPGPGRSSRTDCSAETVLLPTSKSMPALITPKSRVWQPAALSTARKTPAPTVPTVSARVKAPEEILGDGVLAPTLIVGLGGTGLAFLRATRQLIADRFGRPTLPHLRWLQIDTDPAAVQLASSGSAVKALDSEEVLLATLRRPMHYLSREGIAPVDTWLKQEDLFRIPRTPSTEGIRCLGRLALCDHYHVICHRIRTALEPLLNPICLEEAIRLTGQRMWTNLPRVVVAASLHGGTGSGMFLDFTYVIRRELRNMGCSNIRVSGLLGVPAWISQTSNSRNIGNVRTALAELNHYHHPESCYAATFDTREGSVTDPDRPFHRVTLIPLPGICDRLENERSDALAAEVLFTELLTPLGRTTATATVAKSDLPFTVVGMQRLNWPRKTILKTASTLLARRTLTAWMSSGTDFTGSYPRDLIASQWQERQLSQEFLRNIFEEHLKDTLGQPLQEALYKALLPLMDDDAEESDLARASQAFGKLVVLLGRPGTSERDYLPTIPAALQTKVQELGHQADSRLASSILALIEQPGLRVGATEEAIRLLRERLSRAIAKVEQAAMDSEDDAAKLFAPIHQQLLASTSKSSGRTIQRALLPVEHSRAMKCWALARLQGQVLGACAGVYRIILGNVPELIREVTVVRTQLTNFLKQLDAGGKTSEIHDGLSRPVFADGTNSIFESATLLLDSIRPEELREFDTKLQGQIRHECRGVTGACTRPREFGAAFVQLLTEQASRFLDSRLPSPTASPILKALAERADAGGEDRIADLLDRATPGDLGQGKPNLTVIGVPASAEAAVDVVRSFCREEIHVAPSEEDFVIWRESRRKTVNAFTKLCGEQGDTTHTAHSRSDVNWLPLS